MSLFAQKKKALLSVFSIFDALNHCRISTLTGYNGNISCPFHEDSKPSMHIYGDTNLAHCFTEDKTWDAIEFVAEYEKRNYLDIFNELCGLYEIDNSSIIDNVSQVKSVEKVEVLSGSPKKRLSQVMNNWDFWSKKIFER